MKRTMKHWIIVAAILIMLGTIMLVGTIAAADFEFSSVSTQKLVKNVYTVNENFENMLVHVETADVTFALSADNVCRVECVEEERLKYEIKVQDGTLVVEAIDSRQLQDYIGIRFRTPTVKLFLPKDAYTALSVTLATGDVVIPDHFSFEAVTVRGTTSDIFCDAGVSKHLEVHTTTGDIDIGPVETESIGLFATTGRIAVNDVHCNALTAQTSTGRIKLDHVVAKESFHLENTTGGVDFWKCDAGQIDIKTSTGDVRGTVLSEKMFAATTLTGSISLPKTMSGGKCTIMTTTGDIKVELA